MAMHTITLVMAFLAYSLHSRRVASGLNWTMADPAPNRLRQHAAPATLFKNRDLSTPRREVSMQSSSPRIKFYTHTACPFAQRVWIALEASGMPYEKVGVNLYGSGGFDKSELKKVESSGGLKPKGYIPVMSIDDEVIRESSVLVDRVAELSAEVSGATSLLPEKPDVARELIRMCNSLPTSTSSFELSALLKKADKLLGESTFLAGETFSVADACLLPFFQRIEENFPGGATNLQSYMDRMKQQPAFSKTVVSSWWYWW
mmetsp:Transcript_66956/g.119020  ORF Transcript_66956/g.119020 Transcript_66956/m.119020 type:complete len:260 (+) Transcript_66956:31-810(+)